ncbi:MAG: hypothetical protein PWR27_1489 [Petroclostridium sp.]|jgi:hypothetical protein|uniref:vitamin B12 dependent-methionine synthase activation domain-containing protein n=1 Tax=Petroclostridium xylanilyticum TaxID=1792311 RepID=UPI000B97F292|nr:vitamin B12 dependent-methionine synthase activation domain-containing protein [Petroclostridium xylanilyticum]MBZ4645398.1 Vitamin dependent methionine synthase activation region [Clostridia bacterium]MDK2810780.1 hypothetical protein [Petroclostridium sp.]
MANIKYLESIPAEPKRDMILLRLGYKKNVTILNDEQKDMLEDSIKQGLLLCHPKGAFGRFAIIERSSNFVKLEGGEILESESLARLLEKSDEVLLMASTVGKEIVQRISTEVTGGDAALGVILDSVASQTADAGLNWMMDFINKLIRREGKKLTKHRYSPGYGDLPLSNQKIIFDMLGLNRLGLKLTEKYMLIPEKSVLAIAGIEGIEEDE